MDIVISIDLDSLLDTRIATVSSLDPDAAIKMLCDEDYTYRLQDDFTQWSPLFTQEAYIAEYAKRDVETLKYARITHMAQYLYELTIDFEQEQIDRGKEDRVEVKVNLFPYNLRPLEVEEIIGMMSSFVGPLTTVTTEFVNPRNLYPMHIGNVYSVLIMYGFHDWLEHHHKAIITHKNPSITIVTPAIAAPSTKFTKEDFKDEKGKDVDPFEATRVLLLEFIGLRMIDSRNLSIAIETKKRHRPQSPTGDWG